ncbi:MAG: hypothetical protein IJE04_02130 [Bacilli bacterium]|nr:hypothetical protein [Bacilli bacterium]
MKEKLFNTSDGIKYKFSRFYIIKNNYLFSTSNANLGHNLKTCCCIKKLGSNVRPKIYLDIKKDNKIIMKNKLIGDYQALMDFIVEHQNDFIFIKGFSRASMAEFIAMLNIKKQMNIKPVKFKNKILEAQYERHLLTKEQRIEELNKKLENGAEVDSAEQYMKITNSVFGINRYKSRQKIIQLRKNS